MSGTAILGVIQLFVALVAVAALVAMVARRVAVPYTVALVVVGLAAPLVAPSLHVAISPQLVLVVLLPGLVFEAAYHTDFHELRSSSAGVALLAVPGVLISAGIVAVTLNLATGMALQTGFIVGAIVSATDPAAVIATFRQLGSPRRLATLVEAESLFNDGTGLVLFAVALQAATSQMTLADAEAMFVTTIVASVAIGLAGGFVASRIIVLVDDHLVELAISLVTAYGTYLVADAAHQSGVIATVIAGIVLGTYGRRIGMSERTQEALDTVWEFVAFLLTALVFLLVGLAITLPNVADAIVPIAWTVAAILAGRALVVYVLLGGTSRVLRRRWAGQALPRSWLHVTFWSGLRGAVALAMVLSLPEDLPGRPLLEAITFGVILFTLLAQGTTVEWVIARTGAGTAAHPSVESDRAPAPVGSDKPPAAPETPVVAGRPNALPARGDPAADPAADGRTLRN